MAKKRILLIAGDTSVCSLIKSRMENENMNIYSTSSLAEALDSFMKQEYCLVILDFDLPEMNVFEMLRLIRGIKHAPILVIAPRLIPNEKVALFQAGANACIEKPLDITVCAAQAETLMRFYLESDNKSKKHYLLEYGEELLIRPLYRQVIVDGTPLDLTRTEFDLLLCLADHEGQVWSRSRLYSYVWADSLGLDGENTVRTHIGNLRKKLADVGKEYVQTVRGSGYKFVPPKVN